MPTFFIYADILSFYKINNFLIDFFANGLTNKLFLPTDIAKLAEGVEPVAMSGIDECRANLLKLKFNKTTANFFEGMACDGGCLNGALSLHHDVNKQRLQFFKRNHAVYRALSLLHSVFKLLACARSYEYRLDIGIFAFEKHCSLDHRRRRRRYVFDEFGEILFDKHNERRTARSRHY